MGLSLFLFKVNFHLQCMNDCDTERRPSGVQYHFSIFSFHRHLKIGQPVKEMMMTSQFT